jgi:putative peptidoglycan lipid II flippase
VAAVVVLAVVGVVMAAVYAGMLRLLRATELSQLTGSLLAQFRRSRGTKTSN